MVVYYVLGLALFSQASYEEVMRELVEGLSWASGWAQSWQMPTKAALFKARARLGPEPLRVLFEAAAVPLATAETKGAWYRGWRLMSIDGTCINVADNRAVATAQQNGRDHPFHNVAHIPAGHHAIVERR